ncbi:MAG: hypothetical protein IPJ65_35755 [Archangiaceae bacterium]|nr:hypothetical protein [Archangiaceae bacterium]
MRTLTCLLAVLLAAGCNCNNVAVNPDGGSAGGSTAGGTGGGSTAGGTGGGSTAGGQGGATAGGSTAGGQGGGNGGGSTAGGAGGGSTAGGNGGGSTAGGNGGGSTAGGVGGGSTAGGLGGGNGGGVAGGATAGGTGGAGGGAMGCVGAPAGTYVCPSCPMASDSNTGTASCPLTTIGRGLANAATLNLGKVFVASKFNAGVAMVYPEDVSITRDVLLEGKYLVTGSSGALNWGTRSANPADRSIIQNTNAAGLRFSGPLTGAAGLDGIAVRTGGAGTDRLGVAISDCSPSLTDFTVSGTPLGSGVAVNEVGVFIVASGAVRVAPKLSGPAGGNSVIGGIRGSTSAVGLRVSGAQATITSLNINEIDATGGTGTAVGVQLVNASNTTYTNGSIGVRSGQVCFGVAASGETSNIVFDNVPANGCNQPAQVNVGVAFDNCSLNPGGGAAPIYRNVTGRVLGGPIAGSSTVTASAVGMLVSDGCALDITNVATIVGVSQAQSVSGSTTFTAGVVCTNKGLARPNGADAPCRIAGSSLIQGSQVTPSTTGSSVSAGIWCVGSCAASNAACAGSCKSIIDNRGGNGIGSTGGGVVAGFGSTQVNLYVEQSSPVVSRNAFIGGANGPCTLGTGALLLGSSGTYTNNAIVGPSCTQQGGGTSIGVDVVDGLRSDGSHPSPLLNSNTVLAYASGNTPPTQVGLRLEPGGGVISVNSTPVGSYLNNIFQAGPGGGGTKMVAFEETSRSIDPKELTSNDFHVVGGGTSATLYQDEGSAALITAAQINALTDCASSANVSVDPQFTPGAFPHLSATSALLGAGPLITTANTPSDDFDGLNTRPQPVTSLRIDIGADER